MGPNAAGFIRYAFGAPVSICTVAAIAASGVTLPRLNLRFLVVIAIGGLAQIVGTNLLIRSFALRNFAIGTTYAKTEILQVAVLAAVLLGEPITAVAVVGIIICLVGVVILALRGDLSRLRDLVGSGADKAMWAGTGAGLGLGLATICIRSASKALGTSQPIVRALTTLAVMNAMQAVVNTIWLRVKAPNEFAAIRERLGASVLVGLLSVCGSAGWAIAVTLQNAALVKAVGQIDLVFAFLVGRFFFHEPGRRSEFLGSAVVVTGVVVILLS